MLRRVLALVVLLVAVLLAGALVGGSGGPAYAAESPTPSTSTSPSDSPSDSPTGADASAAVSPTTSGSPASTSPSGTDTTSTTSGTSSSSSSSSPTSPTSTAPPAPPIPVGDGTLLVIGTGGITWSDVSRETTPTLWTLMRDGSSAVMAVRSVYENACPVDGWLGLSSGSRAAADRPGAAAPENAPCSRIPEPTTYPDAWERTSAKVPGWDAYVAATRNDRMDARLGLLGDQVARADACVMAVGPGAGIAAARADGTVNRWFPWDRDNLLEPLNTCRITFVDVGALRDPADVAKGEQTSGPRTQQLKDIDARIAQTIAAAPGGADVVVASLSDAGRSERLRLIVAKGPHFGPGALVSNSTQQPGLVQLPDLTATLLDLVGQETPATLGGAVLTSQPAPDNSARRAADRLQALIDRDQASHEVHSLVAPFFKTFGVAQLVLYALVLLIWKGRVGSQTKRLDLLRWTRVITVVAAAVPASTFLANLIPWWRYEPRMLAIVGSIALFVLVISWLSLSGPWGRTSLGPMAAVSAVTMAVLAGDVMTGSRLQLSSLMGLQPVLGGRFYGMGNVTFALFATSALLLITVLSSVLVAQGRRKAAAILTTVIGVTAIIIDGAPFFGADGGGPPALVPGIIVLILTILGLRLTLVRALLTAVGAVLVFVVIAVADWSRGPGSRTHLGNFTQAVLDGTAGDIVMRKGEQNIQLLKDTVPFSLLVPVFLLALLYFLLRPTSWGGKAFQKAFDRAPTLRAGVVALLVTWTIGMLINDSGVAIPAVGATLAVPLLLSVILRSAEEAGRSAAPTRRARRS